MRYAISLYPLREKHLDRLGEIMTVIDRMHEESQALPFSIYVERQ